MEGGQRARPILIGFLAVVGVLAVAGLIWLWPSAAEVESAIHKIPAVEGGSYLTATIESVQDGCDGLSGGACKTVPSPNPRLPMMEPKLVVTPRVERKVPQTLTPGVYHFWHAATDAKGNTTGYIVAPIAGKD